MALLNFLSVDGRNRLSRLLFLVVLTIYIYFGLAAYTHEPALATVTKLEPTATEVIYRSHKKLDDQSGKVWQVVLFKQVYPDQPATVNLRLVGFPGYAEIIHPQPLQVTTAGGRVLRAEDVFLEEAPEAAIGQYNFTNILPQLAPEPVVLSIPLPRHGMINISVPQSVVREWQLVAEGK